MRFLRRKEVEHRTGLARATIYAKVKARQFPAPVKISAGAVAWLEDDVTRWQTERIAASRSN